MPEKEKEKDDNKLNLRSEEIQDIMDRTPSWIIRSGITMIFILLLLGIYLTYLIQYPDIIKGPVKLTTEVLPVKIVSQVSGNIVNLYVKDGETVKVGTVIAEIENPLSAEAAEQLKSYISILNLSIMVQSPQLPLPDTSGLALGDLQYVLNELIRTINDFNLRKSYHIDEMELGKLRERLGHEMEMLKINEKMLALSEKDLENAKLKFETDKKLYEQGVIARTDFLQLETNYRSKQMQVEQLRQNKVQTSITISSMQEQLSQSGYNKASRDQSGYQDVKAQIKTINSYIFGWKQKYSLIASKTGVISYLSHLQEKHFVKAGEELFAILQPNETFIGLATVPTAGMGKVEVGQDVHLLLDNFPYYEYGMVQGKVKYIAALPNGNEYRVDIALPDGMLSSHNQKLKFTPEMTGQVEIVTENKRVIERIFTSFVKVFKKR